uniref:Uncharacterized protein n=1 Tax=Timema monikensis TaxID=170555 RepID=A0A7R9EGJ6_9NEOP|nr:unnamed protein product [Timema monikensis]
MPPPYRAPPPYVSLHSTALPRNFVGKNKTKVQLAGRELETPTLDNSATKAKRSAPQLKKFWKNEKARRKKLLAAESRRRMATGDGSFTPGESTDPELEAILSTPGPEEISATQSPPEAAFSTFPVGKLILSFCPRHANLRFHTLNKHSTTFLVCCVVPPLLWSLWVRYWSVEVSQLWISTISKKIAPHLTCLQSSLHSTVIEDPGIMVASWPTFHNVQNIHIRPRNNLKVEVRVEENV